MNSHFFQARPTAAVTDFKAEYLGVQTEPHDHYDRVVNGLYPDFPKVVCGIANTPQEAYEDAREQVAERYKVDLLPLTLEGLPDESVAQWATENDVDLNGPLEAMPFCTVALFIKIY